MKKLLTAIVLGLAMTSCGGETCSECTGTVTNTGETADWTVCENDDGTITRTNNIANTSETDSLDYVGSVAFLVSLGLECN